MMTMTYAEKNWGDCSNAVAYSLNFVQICYLADSKGWSDFFTSSCSFCERFDVQIENLQYPKSRFSKKDYFYLDIGYYGVSTNLYNDMIEFGVNKNNFKPIYNTDKTLILGYQIVPMNILSPIFDKNYMTEVDVCHKCGSKIYEYFDDSNSDVAYDGLGYPVYITEETLENLKSVNGTFENTDTIISLELYEYLIKKYPKLECRPVFVGDLKQDGEYIRLSKTK